MRNNTQDKPHKRMAVCDSGSGNLCLFVMSVREIYL